MTQLPKTMRALRLTSAASNAALSDAKALDKHLELIETELPKPGPGEVLVKVSRGTINPNDLYHLQGEYVMTEDQPLPAPTGFEGAGVVVASGGGLIGKARVGKRVAFYQLGMFAEYIVCKALDVIPIPAGVDFQTAAASVANPMTVQAMLQVIRATRSPAFVNTAAASALGRLLIRGSQQRGPEIICVVRREEQAEICRAEGARHVVNSSAPDFAEQLQAVIAETGCRLALDCIGGDMPDHLLRALPRGGVVKMYGYMTPGPVQFAPQSLYRSRRLETFEVNEYLDSLSLPRKGLMAQAISKGMGKDFSSTVQRGFALEDGAAAFAFYSQNMTGGKVQIIADPALV